LSRLLTQIGIYSRRTRNTTIAVPSLRRLSPSIRVASLLEAPSSFKSTTTATGSVAEAIDPNRREASQVKTPVYYRIYVIMSALKNVATISIGPAMMSTWPISTLNICQSELNADSKISAGMNSSNSR